MKAIAKTHPGSGVELIDVAEPCPGPAEVVFVPEAAAICGSDLAIYRWEPWTQSLAEKLPFVLGHEVCGAVSAVGTGVTRVKPGDRVAVETHIPCGVCWYCTHDRAHVCENMVLFGHETNGCFSEVARVNERAVWRIESDIPAGLCALMEPLGVALRSAEAADLRGLDVAVVGAGPIGLLAVTVAATKSPETLIVVEPSARRRELAAALGATAAVDPREPGLVEHIRSLTRGPGVEVVIECSGNAGAVLRSIDYTRVGGHLILVGNPEQDLVIDAHRRIIHQELTIRGIWGRTLWDTWARVESFILQHADRLQQIITSHCAIEDYQTAFDLAFSGNEGKVLLTPQ